MIFHIILALLFLYAVVGLGSGLINVVDYWFEQHYMQNHRFNGPWSFIKYTWLYFWQGFIGWPRVHYDYICSWFKGKK